MDNEIYEFEICRNAEGGTLAYANLKGDSLGYRIAGPKGWGGTKTLANIEIKQHDLVEFVQSYAPRAHAQIVAAAAAEAATSPAPAVVQMTAQIEQAMREAQTGQGSYGPNYDGNKLAQKLSAILSASGVRHE